jgi:predicted patatin/cPLA2 family phospholipase
MTLQRIQSVIIAFAMVAGLTGWKALERKPALPPVYANEASIDGMTGVRYAVNQMSGIDALLKDLESSLKAFNKVSPGTPVNYLSISGGGGKGAFGAGLLNGWTKHGDRPEFNMVTGVSTGALMAPFAFLGPEYDPTLKALYTNVNDNDIFRKRNYSSVLLSDGLSDTTPLHNLISKYVTPEFMQKVANEYNRRHRWLLIATNNLDTGQPIIWNMGKIASYGTPEALALFRNVMLASASLPGFFSPVMINVDYQGKSYQEMHVDGGVSRQVFIYPASLFRETGGSKLLEGRKREAYLIRNDILDSENYQTVERKTLAIANQALGQFAHSHGDGDILLAYLTARQDGFGFRLAFVAENFINKKPKSQFDSVYMQALFNYAETRAAKGYHWLDRPPGLSEAVSTSLMKYRDGLESKSK